MTKKKVQVRENRNEIFNITYMMKIKVHELAVHFIFIKYCKSIYLHIYASTF